VNSGTSSLWKWTVSSEAAGVRSDLAILRALGAGEGDWEGEKVEVSRSRIQKLMEEGQILATGAPLRGNEKLASGTSVEARFPAPRSSELIPQDAPLEILYQDEHLVVVNKPPGLTVHPSDTQTDGTLVHILLHHIKDLSGIGGELRPGIVHRIDKDTSGALVVSKTDAAHRVLAESFANHTIERSYWAFCYGAPAAPLGTIDTLIGRNPTDRKKMSIDVKEGRRAVTHWSRTEEYGTLKSRAFASFIEARLETGRTHQVRVHLTSLSHSLLGDPTYGVPSERNPKWLALPVEVREAVRALPGQALHARVLGFDHPITGVKLRFEAEPPAQLRALMNALGKYR
jgi:23S rRNA pseudouridine1911/1915/1917 synthase